MKHIISQKIGLGTAPLGNMFREVPEEEAQATIEAAWNAGIRYYDTAPFYGAGLAEIRLGAFLSKQNRDEYVLSSKVGRVIEEEIENKEGLFEFGRANKVITDYSAEATHRSIKQSLERLKTDRLDMVFVHDLSPDFHGDEWIAKFEQARTGAFKVLDELQEQGVIKGWGLGVNTTIPIELALQLEEAHPSISLQATQYTLLDHKETLRRMMPEVEKKDMGIVVGAPYSSGALLGGENYNYGEIPPEIKEKIKQFEDIAESHGVSLKAAALQFSTAHPAVAAVIPGSTRPERIQEDLDALSVHIPEAFWQELIEKELVSVLAPLPKS
ncbi:aldo/keto reductase [Alkalicoccobacillus murimartini]|uniref:D-threo-aldose 1-dehydrogenase n=1 Tax=Alkalicoccobacillus murimartini TaxID=171685 RepID=A0ABT9YIN2_9BACI|nr:aldo/keto reductase [Alkalicoccobacillus murimartini]MDQ0207566.1 D-threo-aldose 1-dehydrogenase [Alkalicoccobacillus murimartini]